MAQRLQDAEIVTVAEIVEESYQVTEFQAQNLTGGQLASLRADITTWTGIRDKHLKIKGGRDGIDLDNERKRNAIRTRVRQMLLMEDTSGGCSIRVYRG